jgi:nucleotide-binding universal stress UspA family protein
MIRHLIVPLDGSELSERALPFGRVLAGTVGARLVLLRVVPPVGPFDSPEPGERAKAMADASDYVSSLVVPVEGEPPVDALAYGGEPASSIVDEARARPASMIVMSTHGRTGVGELIFGSVTREVIHRAQSAVLVIPPGCKQPWSGEPPGRILVPLDGSKLAEAILPGAAIVARMLGAELTLLRVVAVTSYMRVEGYPDPVGVPTTGISGGEAEAYLADVAREIREDGQRVTDVIVEGTNVATAILDAAEERRAALIAMATHGRTGLADATLGSVAAAVVKEATVPVLLQRPTVGF